MANAHYNWSEHGTINLDTYTTNTQSPDSSLMQKTIVWASKVRNQNLIEKVQKMHKDPLNERMED